MNETTPILVEGKRDVHALRNLGCRGTVVPLHNGQPLFNVAEDFSREAGDVILLTDWDRKGDQLSEVLEANLAANGVRVDVSFRLRIRDIVASQLKDVESLLPHVRRNLARFHQRTLDEHARSVHGFGAFLHGLRSWERAHG